MDTFCVDLINQSLAIMGCGISKGDLKAVEEVTGMSENDVKEAYKGFKKENKAVKINLAKFTKLVASMNTNKGKFYKSVKRIIIVSFNYLTIITIYNKFKLFSSELKEMEQNIQNIFFEHLIQTMTIK